VVVRLSFVIVALAGCEPGPVTFVPNLTDAGGDDDDDDTGDPFGSGVGKVCDSIDEDGTCSQYTGTAWDLDTAEQNCHAGTFYPVGVCPPATLGECTFAIGQPLERVASYYVGDWYDIGSESGVASNCGLGEGSWSSSTGSGGTR
jgi:hypothetical protein